MSSDAVPSGTTRPDAAPAETTGPPAPAALDEAVLLTPSPARTPEPRTEEPSRHPSPQPIRVLLRPAALSDAAALAAAYLRNREHLAPWEPPREESFYTATHQEQRLAILLEGRAAGQAMPWLLVTDGPDTPHDRPAAPAAAPTSAPGAATSTAPAADAGTAPPAEGSGPRTGERVVGAVTLQGIVRGPAHSATLGYWVDAALTRRGLARAAVTQVCRLADTALDLHRLQAGAVTHNTASQRVLERSGFERYGLSRQHLWADGAWRDTVLYERILNDRPLN
ncbi:GNAT family N-acetyltransferase [Streptomyces sp. NPDC059740]|uniref:GNAT family N-acetyltransferase n=1 Tax=Streptomyces sp. NPDC059740 TaxID=3346926 RepID=UPI00365DA1FA